MAKYFLFVKVFSRGKGSRATRAAAYRAGERIRDERTSESYNYSNRQDVVHKEILLPSQFAGRVDMNWARERSRLWNAAEHAGRQRNSRLAREVLVILPPELTSAQRTNLVRTFSQELADKYRNAVDFAVHEPRAGSDERHHHAHMLMTNREVTPEGLGARTALELSGRERHARGLGSWKNDFLRIRERWAQATNRALQEAGLAERVDHRSYKDQGIDREPKPMIPQRIYYAERKSGVPHPAGVDIRARYRERVEARHQGRRELARVLQKQKEMNRARAIAHSARKQLPAQKPRHSMLTREELNQQQRERYRTKQLAANSLRDVNREARPRAANVAANPLLSVRDRESSQAGVGKEAGTAQGPGAGIAQGLDAVAEQAVKNWLALRKDQQPETPAAQALKNWQAFRESQTATPTAEESARKWLALHQADKASEATHATPRDLSSGKEAEGDDKNREKSAGRGLDYDLT